MFKKSIQAVLDFFLWRRIVAVAWYTLYGTANNIVFIVKEEDYWIFYKFYV